MAQRSLAKRLWYVCLQFACRLTGVVLYRVRCHGSSYMPPEGGALVLPNHQSHLDPILIGLASDRQMNYLARQTLFEFAPFRWLIKSLDAIPLDREGLGIGGLKETLRRLKRGEMVLIFPEGTRSPNGEVGPLKPGFCALAKRAAVPLIPVAITGAYEAWPKRNTYPRLGVIEIQFGPPIMPEEIGHFEDREIVAEVDRRIRACLAQARARLAHRLGKM